MSRSTRQPVDEPISPGMAFLMRSHGHAVPGDARAPKPRPAVCPPVPRALSRMAPLPNDGPDLPLDPLPPGALLSMLVDSGSVDEADLPPDSRAELDARRALIAPAPVTAPADAHAATVAEAWARYQAAKATGQETAALAALKYWAALKGVSDGAGLVAHTATEAEELTDDELTRIASTCRCGTDPASGSA